MNSLRRGWLAVALCLVLASRILHGQAAAPAASLPQTAGETLAGKELVIAESVRGRAAILVITFSRKAAKEAAVWTKRLTAEPSTSPELVVHQVAHLQDVPGLLRGLVTGIIRRGTPSQLHSTFVVLLKDQGLWKQFVNFQKPDTPYIVLLNQTGEAIWRTQGIFDEEKQTALRVAVKELLSAKAPA